MGNTTTRLDSQSQIIDITDESQVLELSRKHYNLSIEYSKHRNESAKHEYHIDVLIASRMEVFREHRNNIGYETARVMLLEEKGEHRQEIHDAYRDYKKHTAKYKGLEKVLDSIQGQISLIQSLIKNRREST